VPRSLCHGVAVASARSKYVLCVDDDVQLHQHTLTTLVSRLEGDASLFVATGVPFDVPAPGSGLLTYCMLVYHLPILIAFSVLETTFNVWGGCMLLPLDALRSDRYGIVRAWREGGYSDDLTVAAKCTQHGLKIFCGGSAIFVQHLEPHVTWAKFWNYLRRYEPEEPGRRRGCRNERGERGNHAERLTHFNPSQPLPGRRTCWTPTTTRTAAR